jgi:DNA-directed RNA polymerase subunit K/omega
MAAQEFLELNLDDLEKRGISRYKAVLMAAQEARFINDQIKLDITKATEKPTTMALKRLFDGQIIISDESDTEA